MKFNLFEKVKNLTVLKFIYKKGKQMNNSGNFVGGDFNGGIQQQITYNYNINQKNAIENQEAWRKLLLSFGQDKGKFIVEDLNKPLRNKKNGEDQLSFLINIFRAINESDKVGHLYYRAREATVNFLAYRNEEKFIEEWIEIGNELISIKNNIEESRMGS